MKATRINPAQAVAVIDGIANGQIFTVTFVKRTTGELRTMNCRRGVKKHLKGGEAAYSFRAKNLISVFDLVKGGYRCFPLDALREIKTEQTRYKVAQ